MMLSILSHNRIASFSRLTSFLDLRFLLLGTNTCLQDYVVVTAHST